MEYYYLLGGLLVGAIVAYLFSRINFLTKYKNYISTTEIEHTYVLRAIHTALEKRVIEIQQELIDLKKDYILVSKSLATKEQFATNLQEKLSTQEANLKELQRQFAFQFEHLANKILEEKSQTFTRQNQENLNNLLVPLKDKIKNFEDKVERNFLKNTENSISLREEIKHLKTLNAQLSNDASDLANALKGDTKFQGDWGEFRLETLLERAGLEKDLQFSTQSSFRDENGRLKRPDFIVNLPDNKHLIIDSKVSLTAYNNFFNADNELDKQVYLKKHLDSIKQHIKELSAKNYQQLYQINTPDYVLMFVPIEGAFSLALQQDKNIFTDALDKNVVVVTSSTLLATMRTVAYIWKQERQKRNVLEIAKQSGLLYDKFVGFVEDMNQIGRKIKEVQTAYGSAMNKMSDSKKYGDTLIGRAERIKKLGANATKSLPNELLEN